MLKVCRKMFMLPEMRPIAHRRCAILAGPTNIEGIAHRSSAKLANLTDAENGKKAADAGDTGFTDGQAW
ncbi:hypothetical protein [Paenibacillus elgii]|uniref:hypothetical protein n=1 Tax=Paenibacillus elgii TaxID=189691 RepID=UPI000248DC58|nr:hypothetical protein [Paenibacillus elgii]